MIHGRLLSPVCIRPNSSTQSTTALFNRGKEKDSVTSDKNRICDLFRNELIVREIFHMFQQN